jgi:hypothetical protein
MNRQVFRKSLLGVPGLCLIPPGVKPSRNIFF